MCLKLNKKKKPALLQMRAWTFFPSLQMMKGSRLCCFMERPSHPPINLIKQTTTVLIDSTKQYRKNYIHNEYKYSNFESIYTLKSYII